MFAAYWGSTLALVTVCAAKPVARGSLFQPLSLDPPGISDGFPTEYLPPTESANSTGVGLPIIPGQPPDFHPILQWQYEGGPRSGLRLATSIFQVIYYAWRNTANQPLRAATVERQNPFDEWEFLMQPSLLPGTILTPLKIGLTYCWILNGILQLQQWPGLALANIIQARQNIGRVSIKYSPLSPQPGSTDSSSAENSTNTNALTATPFQNQQRWLRCYWGAVHFIIAQSPSGLVTNNPAFAAQSTVRRYPFPCGNSGVLDRLDFFIYPDAKTLALQRN
ncbi:MAG: hypothetical protein Q9222_002785 [Ikaeria aurantiellina]